MASCTKSKNIIIMSVYSRVSIINFINAILLSIMGDIKSRPHDHELCLNYVQIQTCYNYYIDTGNYVW